MGKRVIEKKYPCKNANSRIYEKLFGCEWWAEWYFHEGRRWRFDFACPELKIAIEVDGGIFIGGRHSQGIGQIKDWEKTNTAAVEGWIVLHCTPEDMFDLGIRNWVEQAKRYRDGEKS